MPEILCYVSGHVKKDPPPSEIIRCQRPLYLLDCAHSLIPLILTLLWHVADDLCKGHLSRPERSKFVPFLPFLHIHVHCPFIKNLLSYFLSVLAWSFHRIVLTNCEETVMIESLLRSFSRSEKVWLIFTYFSMLISGIEMLAKCIAWFSFQRVILVRSQILMVLK